MPCGCSKRAGVPLTVARTSLVYYVSDPTLPEPERFARAWDAQARKRELGLTAKITTAREGVEPAAAP